MTKITQNIQNAQGVAPLFTLVHYTDGCPGITGAAFLFSCHPAMFGGSRAAPERAWNNTQRLTQKLER